MRTRKREPLDFGNLQSSWNWASARPRAEATVAELKATRFGVGPASEVLFVGLGFPEMRGLCGGTALALSRDVCGSEGMGRVWGASQNQSRDLKVWGPKHSAS